MSSTASYTGDLSCDFAETAVRLGEAGHVVGVLTTPAVLRTSALPVIILNAGVLHRVGPHRLHVKLARRLASTGIPALRLDLSGIGDSRPVPSGLTFKESAVRDASDAMSRLEQEFRSGGFVLFGICSGADNGLATAVADPRVRGLIMVDGPAYATPRSLVRREMSRAWQLADPSVALSWGGQQLDRLRARLDGIRAQQVESLSDATTVEPPQAQGRVPPPIDLFGSALTALLDRDVRLLTIYSGALAGRYNHEDQIFEWFPSLRGRLDRAYFGTANHTFTELSEQSQLLDTVLDWVDRGSC